MSNGHIFKGAFLCLCLLGTMTDLPGQPSVVERMEDKEVITIMIEDATSELARNEVSLDQVRSIYKGLESSSGSDAEMRLQVTEHIRYYEDLIKSQKEHLAQLRERRSELERQELQWLRDLYNFGSPYQNQKRTAFLDLILKPRASSSRFGDSGKTRLESLDDQLFAAIGGLQGRLNQERENRREAGYILLDRESNVNTIVEMQAISQAYYDERFVLYDKMNQTYENMLRWRPDLAMFFKPPPQPKTPEAYKRALERMKNEAPSPTPSQ